MTTLRSGHEVTIPINAILPNGYSHRQIAAAVSPRVQELILLPTEKCNFRCTYCYEDFSIGRMSETTQRSIELFLERRVPELRRLTLSWFGGEPLVAKEVVLRLAAYARALCDRHGVTLRGGLTTNAYLLDIELAKKLLELKQDFFQITLDGWGEFHDVLRRRADGKGTFQRIWNNLLGLHSLPDRFEVVVRVHVRRDNLDNLRILMREFARQFAGDSRFRLDFQHLRNMGGTGGATVAHPLDLQELEQEKRELLRCYNDALAESSGRVTPTEADERVPRFAVGESAGGRRSGDWTESEPYICYAASPNSLLIRANGRIGKCTVALTDERNDLGYVRADGTLQIDNQKLTPWIRGLATLDNDTTGCPLQHMPPPPTATTLSK